MENAFLQRKKRKEKTHAVLSHDPWILDLCNSLKDMGHVSLLQECIKFTFNG